MTPAPLGIFRTRADLLFRTSDGRNLAHEEPAEFILEDGERYQVPIGSTTDGISMPEGEAYALCLPYIERGFRAGDLHDSAYRDYLQRWDGQAWVQAHLPKPMCDLLFLSALHALALPPLVCEAFYQGVKLGGQSSFDQDRAQAIAEGRGPIT